MNWAEILIGFIGTGGLTTVINWFLWGKKDKSADYTDKVQGIYDKLSEHLENKVSDIKEEIKTLKEELKNVNSDNRTLQIQFNDLNLAYTKEVEKSQNWEKLHSQLKDQYQVLEKDHEKLKIAHECLKNEVDTLRKGLE